MERTLSMAFLKARQTNTTDASVPARIPQVATPSGKGDNAAQATASAVFDLSSAEGGRAEVHSNRNRIIVVPFGAGSDTNTFTMRVIGWRRVFDRNIGSRDDNALWIPVTLAEFTCTLSTPVGVVNKVLPATDRFADTIALAGTSGNDDVDISITSPADNTIAHAVIDMKGFQKVELTFGTGSSATSCNALVSWY